VTAEGFSLRRLHGLAKSRVGDKTVLRQWVEMLGLRLLHGNGPGYYQLAGFWRHGQSWSTMARHLSYRQYKAHIDALNPRVYQKLSQSKLAEKAIFTLMGIPTPRFLGLLDRACGRDATGAPLRSAEDLVRLIAEVDVDRLCFKLLEGHGGKGFMAADVLRGEDEPRFRSLQSINSTDGGVYSASELMTLLGDAPRILEVYIEQHPAYAAFNPTSVNTLRIWVLRRGDMTSIRLAYLRIGKKGSLVDNGVAGGIMTPVDLQTGRLSAAVEPRPTRRIFPVHPEHGAPIEGVVLPMFEEAKALAARCLTVFPRLNFAGVDVAMTPTGPVITEMNVQPSRNGAAYVGVPTKDVFSPEVVSSETTPHPPLFETSSRPTKN